MSSVTDRAVFRLLIQEDHLTRIRQHLMFLQRCCGMWHPIVQRQIPTFRRIITQKICNFKT